VIPAASCSEGHGNVQRRGAYLSVAKPATNLREGPADPA
jgi:hypothetical protein